MHYHRAMMKVGLVALFGCLSACKVSGTGSLMGPGTSGGSSGPTAGTSGGSRPVTMPDLFLLTRVEAEAALVRAGFERPPTLDSSSSCGSAIDKKVVELGRVCYQMPAAGRATGSRLPVTIRVQHEDPWRGELGGGRRWFLMPDLVGTHLDKARASVRSLGFTSKEVKIAFVDEPGCKPNIVCKTLPEGLTRTDTTSDKLFYVGRPPDTAKPPPSVPPAEPIPPTDSTEPTKPSMGDGF